jgi:chromosome segregation ATPase
MEELKKLLALVQSDKSEEAKKIAESITTKITELDDKITANEAAKNEADKKLTTLSAKLKTISSQIGVDADALAEDFEKAIKSLKKSKGGDEIKDKEIEALKAELQKTISDAEALKAETESELMRAVMERDTAVLLPKYKAKALGTTHIVNEIAKRASYKDGKIIIKNDDGTTKRVNGADATVEDLIKEMRDAEIESKESMFFSIEVQESGGQGGGSVADGDFQP